MAYHPWGETTGTSSGTAGTRLFNAKTLDSGTGFYDLGARMYSPEFGRFLSADPVWSDKRNPQSANLYAYALNNPFRYVDPEGRSPTQVSFGPVKPVTLPDPSPNLLVAVKWLRANYLTLFPVSGVTITEGDLWPGVKGSTNLITQNITILENLSVPEAVQTVAHELLHSRKSGIHWLYYLSPDLFP
jgi:RHS repeat-associated protein